MPRYGKPRGRKWRVLLEPAERTLLERERRRREKHCEGVVGRIRVLLLADEARGRKVRTNAEIAARAGVSEATVTNVCRDFCDRGLLDAIKYARGRGSDTARLKATGEVEAAIVAKACTRPPKGYARWTLTLLADAMAVVLEEPLSRATIGRTLRRNGLRPHLTEYWCIPPEASAEFVAAMEDVLAVYARPYDPLRPVWCLDEKPYQLLGEAREPLPMRPGDVAKVDSEYRRDGTVSVFVLCEPLVGTILQFVEPTRAAIDWADKARHLVDVVAPEAETIVLVMDNLNTHSVASLYKAFPPEEARRIASKLEIHYTPKHGSWLDIAEIAINVMTRQCLGRRIAGIDELREELDAWQEAYDADPAPVDWHFTAKDGRKKLKRLYPDFERLRSQNDERREGKLRKLRELSGR